MANVLGASGAAQARSLEGILLATGILGLIGVGTARPPVVSD